MVDPAIKTTPSQLLVSLAALVVIIAGMRASADIIVPFLLAVFIAIICSPALDWLERRGLPRAAAMVTVLVAVTTIGIGITGLVGSSLSQFTNDVPEYTERLNGYTQAVEQWLNGHGVPFDTGEMRNLIDAGRVMKMAAEVFNSFGGVLTNAFLIFLTVVFILFETASFAVKLHAVMDDPEDTLARLGNVTASIKRYLAIKTMTSLLTGVVIGIGLTILGVENAVLWALLAFMLNYVPNIGSIIAAVPAVLFALVQLGVGGALATAAVFAVVNIVIGSVLEPRFMGRGLGLSTLVVFLSLVFWGWVLGPVGMFLSVPLTMTVKIALGARESTRWIAVLLGSGHDVARETSATTESAINRIESGSSLSREENNESE
ncbi:MAG: AI-2E family transporter [Gammaproteobacteria bacterium]|nr:AI-2E family transporter [Gammaproteobacteria bacterium]MDX2460602.1 AI-2E family transporter [Gammaproteobacteria bacterium]